METAYLFAEEPELAEQEISRLGGRVTVSMHKLLVALLPEPPSHYQFEHAATEAPENEPLCRDLLKYLHEPQPPGIFETAGEHAAPPKKVHNNREVHGPFGLHTPATSSYMVGNIAVGIVIVSGDTSDLDINTFEAIKIQAEALHAFNFWSAQMPLVKIYFKPYVQACMVQAKPAADGCNSFEACEQPWMDAALAFMGCGPGLAGVNQYNQLLIKTSGYKWAFTAFFTKYKTFFYAYGGEGRTCLKINAPELTRPIRNIFAHEIGHIFGADDEYAEPHATCTCTPPSTGQVANYNCEKCTSKYWAHNLPCIMKKSTLDMCCWTKGQVGWPYAAVSSEMAQDETGWVHFYQNLVAYTYKGKNYLFGHTPGVHREDDGYRWFISPLSHAHADDVNNEITHGFWNHCYGTMVTFQVTENGETNTFLFAHTQTILNNDGGRYRWFISRLDGSRGVNTELQNGEKHFNFYYDTAVSFRHNGKNYLLALSAAARNSYFIAELTPKGEHLEAPLMTDYFEESFSVLVAFGIGDKNYLYAHCKDEYKWLIAELIIDENGPIKARLNIVNQHHSWTRYYQLCIPFTLKGVTYIYAQTSTRTEEDKGKYRWFISRPGPGDEIKVELAAGYLDKFYGAGVIFTEPPEDTNKDERFFIFCQKLPPTYVMAGRWYLSEIIVGNGMPA